MSAFAPPPRPHPPPPLPGRATHSSGGRGSPGQARRGLGGAHRHAPRAPPTEEVTPEKEEILKKQLRNGLLLIQVKYYRRVPYCKASLFLVLIQKKIKLKFLNTSIPKIFFY